MSENEELMSVDLPQLVLLGVASLSTADGRYDALNAGGREVAIDGRTRANQFSADQMRKEQK